MKELNKLLGINWKKRNSKVRRIK